MIPVIIIFVKQENLGGILSHSGIFRPIKLSNILPVSQIWHFGDLPDGIT
jgi:hypothetical protein